jgi:predicted NBD/HSP70 family sugar kinase
MKTSDMSPRLDAESGMSRDKIMTQMLHPLRIVSVIGGNRDSPHASYDIIERANAGASLEVFVTRWDKTLGQAVGTVITITIPETVLINLARQAIRNRTGEARIGGSRGGGGIIARDGRKVRR